MTMKLMPSPIQRPAIALLTAGAAMCAAIFPQIAHAQKSKGPTDQAVLLGQFGDWGAYTASPGGKKVCFALAKPATAVTDPSGRNRNPSYAFVSTRPAEKVKNEVSVIVGYPQKPSHDASASIGSANYVMYTQNDGAWVKNAAEEAQMVETMRKGTDLVVKSESSRGTKTTDTYSLKGISDALDKVAAECK
ncbi:MAG TPA: invasion associated locus B family protein [Pseudolabrys sp.]|nr:invasion associated locus B family protein [Pseudolabrys sp.]